MHIHAATLLGAGLLGCTLAVETFEFNAKPIVENRTLDDIHHAALAEGGVVTLWHGGASANQMDAMKDAFEKRFPGMTLNVTVDHSAHHSANLDRQLAVGGLYVDSVMLQTLQDYPRWKEEGVLLHYIPADGFQQMFPAFKDPEGAYYGIQVFAWSTVWNEMKLNGTEPPLVYTDFLKPEFKGKIAICYPNDDDAVLHTLGLILREYGLDFWNKLLTQNPTWTRGAGKPIELISTPDSPIAVAFGTTIGMAAQGPLNFSFPTQGAQFTSWPQRGAIFKDAPHPEGAKLLHNWVLSEEYQKESGTWSVRGDIDAPGGYPKIMEMPGTNPMSFLNWMQDRAGVERLRYWVEDKIGTPQGPNPV